MSSKQQDSIGLIGQIYLAALVILTAVFAGPIIGGFELYDHRLDKISFFILTQFERLPQVLVHDVVMAFGFAFLGLFTVFIPALLGIKRGWVIIGLVFMALNIFWWFRVENEVAEMMNRSMLRGVKISILSTYITNAIGAFAGAYAGEALAAFFTSRK